jgi:hypothetical protein
MILLKELFVGFYRPDEKEFKELWNKCHFVFDANMLLNVYRYSELARNTLIDIFTKLNDRIWIPHQVGIEYHFRLLNEIKEQEKTYDELQIFIKNKTKDVEEEYKNYSLRHSNLKMDEQLLKDFHKSVDALCQDLEKQKKSHPDLHITKNQIMNIFEGKVGNPYTQEKINQIANEGESRYPLKQPPGFKDKDKKEIRYHDEVTYQTKYGDLILWNQLIDYSNEKGVPVIFITDDRKEDWWNIIRGEKVGPSPQLLQEFKRKTDNEFYMYQPKQYLNYIANYLNIDIDKETIDAAIKNIDDYKKQVEESPKSTTRLGLAGIANSNNFKGVKFSPYKRSRSLIAKELEEEFGKGIYVNANAIDATKLKNSIPGFSNVESKEIRNVYKYLLITKLTDSKLDTLRLFSRITNTLEELLPSNKVKLEPIGVGDENVSIKITISGPKIENPNLIEIFLRGRLEDFGCDIFALQELKDE